MASIKAKFLSVTTISLLSVGVLAACGSSNNESTSAESSSAAATSAAATTAAAAETTSAAAEETTAAAAEAVIPEGFKVVTATNNGISFAIPADWIEMNAADLAGAVEGSAELEEAAAQSGLDSAALLEYVGSNDLIAMSTDLSTGFSNNVSVAAEPVAALALPQEAELITAIESVAGTPGEYKTIETPLGEGAIMTYNMEMTGQPVAGAYLIVPAGDGMGFSMITISTLDAAESMDLAEKMAASVAKAQ